MDIKEMQSFFTVVDEGNISLAAQRLELAQPALSRQMKKLEASLGVRLFERGNRHIRLTEAGRIFYERVSRILSMVEATKEEILELGSGIAGTIRLGTITTSGASFLPPIIKEFHQRYPKITFQIWEGEGARILDLLDHRLIEIAITRTAVDENIYTSFTLPKEALILAMSKDFAKNFPKDTVALQELAPFPLIIPLRWKNIFLTQCKKIGFTPHFFCVSDSIVQDVLMARLSLGIALLPLATKNLLLGDELIYKRLVEPEIFTNTVISHLKTRGISAIGKRFLGVFRELFFIDEKKEDFYHEK